MLDRPTTMPPEPVAKILYQDENYFTALTLTGDARVGIVGGWPIFDLGKRHPMYERVRAAEDRIAVVSVIHEVFRSLSNRQRY